MGRKTLKVIDDFYDKNIKIGDKVTTISGSIVIKDLKYKNQYGEFILCEYCNEKIIDVDQDSKWERLQGVQANPNNTYGLIGSIHVQGYRNLLKNIGYFVKNNSDNIILGMTYNQTWQLIFSKGTTNAVAIFEQYEKFQSKLVTTIDELPDLDSWYWKINAFDSRGKPYAELTKEALAEIKNAEEYVFRKQNTKRVYH